MKRIRLILTRLDDQDMLTIKEPLFLGIVCDRFVIEDQRGPMVAKPKAGKAPKKGKAA